MFFSLILNYLIVFWRWQFKAAIYWPQTNVVISTTNEWLTSHQLYIYIFFFFFIFWENKLFKVNSLNFYRNICSKKRHERSEQREVERSETGETEPNTYISLIAILLIKEKDTKEKTSPKAEYIEEGYHCKHQ